MAQDFCKLYKTGRGNLVRNFGDRMFEWDVGLVWNVVQAEL